MIRTITTFVYLTLISFVVVSIVAIAFVLDAAHRAVVAAYGRLARHGDRVSRGHGP